VDILPEWQQISLSGQRGIFMVIGAPDAGKSTFARYLFERFQAEGLRTAYLDGDPGQASLGPPTTLTLSLSTGDSGEYPPVGKTWRWFVGSTTPAGHMLPVLAGSARLIQAAVQAGAQAIIHDTSGLVDPAHGGAALKFAKIDLLSPQMVFAIQIKDELEPILQPLRRSLRGHLVVLGPSDAVRRRDHSDRQEYRMTKYVAYFRDARSLTLEWSHYAVFPYPLFALNRLIALRDEAGFTLAIGIIQSIDRPRRRLEVLTPLSSLADVACLHVGDLYLDPGTFRDRRI
jgi:polynucleotide 5'-hydroxyl-kinase GRC3/NOL9